MTASKAEAPSPDHYGPLAHVNTAESRLPAFGGEFRPGLYKSPRQRQFGNPAPLGHCAFALTTFVLGCLEMGVKNITVPSVVVGLPFSYGGLVQLLAGMWEMAVGNTFGATVLSSYGGFWISTAIIFTPGGFDIMNSLEEADKGSLGMYYNSFGLYLMALFIFTFLMVLLTLKSTFGFFSLLLFVDLAFLFLGLGYFIRGPDDNPNEHLTKAGGFFALMGAFLAWYNAFAGMADNSNSFFVMPVAHFPWSEKSRESKKPAVENRDP